MKTDVDEKVSILKKMLKPLVDGKGKLDNLACELGFFFKEIVFDEYTKDLLIVTLDRPDKSAVIGKGGWVVGRLKEELDVNSIHVDAYSDHLIRKYRMKLAASKIKDLLQFQCFDNQKPLLNLLHLIDMRMENIYDLESQIGTFKNELRESKDHKAVVALSGGVDSSFSLIVAKYMGFNPIAVSVNPGNIILPNYFRKNIEILCHRMEVDHEYIKIDMNEVIEGSLRGKFHPCGRCSKLIENALLSYTMKKEIPFLIYGDLLSTGIQSLISENDIFRINLPAMLSATKRENKMLTLKLGIRGKGGYGCPLLSEVHHRYPHLVRFSIQRILRETRSGILEPGEALDMVMRSIG